MSYAKDFDKFRINWTERSRGNVIISVTGYSYQVANWKDQYLKEYSPKDYNTKVLAKIPNNDGTVTVTVSRKIAG
jgi:hypothetical protein